MSDSNRGYQCYRFVSLLNYHMKCKICDNVLRDAMRLVCDQFNLHFFCKNCILSVVNYFEESGEDFLCPVDKNVIKNVRTFISPEHHFQSKINALEIRCSFVNNGCEDILSVKEIDEHEKNCGYHNERLLRCGRCKIWFSRKKRNCFSCVHIVAKRYVELQSKLKEINQRLAAVNNSVEKQDNIYMKVNNDRRLVSIYKKVSDGDILQERAYGQKHKFDHSICPTCFGYMLKYIDYLEKKGEKILMKITNYEEVANRIIDDKDEDSMNYEVCCVCKKWNFSDEEINAEDTWLSCGKCYKWFHFGCTRYKNFGYDSELLENFSFFCDKCASEE